MKVGEVEARIDLVVKRATGAKGAGRETAIAASSKELAQLQREYVFVERATDSDTRFRWRENVRDDLLEIERLEPIAAKSSNPATHLRLRDLEDEVRMWTRKIRADERIEDSEDEG